LIIQIDYSFAWLEEIKFSTCGDLVKENTNVQVYQSEYLEIANQMRAYLENNKKDYNL
jgi:hypothetical protein